MICTGCNQDVRKKDRGDGKCPHCGQRFVLDPEVNHGLTDKAMQGAIDRVSNLGEVQFLPENVWYELGKTVASKASQYTRNVTFALFGLAAVGLGVGLYGIIGVCGFFLGPAVALPGLWLTRAIQAQNQGARAMPPGMSRAVLEGLWSRWKQVHPDIQGLIRGRPTRRPSPDLDPNELAHYSFDRVVVCDDARVVDLLVANRFHFENNCAILSEDGAPAAIFTLVREMVRKNPAIRVYTLHHCTPSGCGLAARLRSDPEWFRDVGQVIDVGLRPEHADELRGAWERLTDQDRAAWAQAADHLRTLDLLDTDVDWLRSWQISLFAVRPEQLLRRLYRAITQAEQAPQAITREASVDGGGGDGGVVVLPGFSGDAGPSEGDGDGFG